MPFYIGNGSIEAGSSDITIKNLSGANVFRRGISTYGGNNFAYFENTNIPAFIAGSTTDPGYVTPAASGVWGKINDYCTTTVYNRGGHYNTSTTRFTAPVRGPYLFIFSTYMYTANYTHPIFSINGGLTSGYFTQYRIRGHGMAANYQQDCQIEEVMHLNAGDYVEVFWYASGASLHYPFYSLFQGVYVG